MFNNKDVEQLKWENERRKEENRNLNKEFKEMKGELKEHMEQEEKRWRSILIFGGVIVGLLATQNPWILRALGIVAI